MIKLYAKQEKVKQGEGVWITKTVCTYMHNNLLINLAIDR